MARLDPRLFRPLRAGQMAILWIASGAFVWLAAVPSGIAQSQNESSASRLRGKVDGAALDEAVANLLKQQGEGAQASIWLGNADGTTWYESGAAAVRPTASAIKAFYLVVLFDRYKDALDRELPGVGEILRDDRHPAISHFTAEQRDEIRRELIGATVRRIGQVMIGQTEVSNVVYNAAANVTTAVLGGPEALTNAIHKLDPAFATVAARRYMLRDRKQPGDNEATAQALSVLYQRLASAKLPGIDNATMQAVRDTLRWVDDPNLGVRYGKGGSLDTDPLTRVRAGWWDTSGGPLVYVVMMVQPLPADQPNGDAAKSMNTTANQLENLIVAAGRKVITP
jgi:hypothetical protein